MRLILSVACATLLAGCWPGVNCTMEARAGVTVTVLDATGSRVCSAEVVAKGEGHEETLMAFTDAPDCVYSGLWERAGTYTITATSARFDGTLEETVTIADGECHVIGEQVELRAP